MDKRNQLTITILSIIIIGGSIATPLTVRDSAIILDDFLNSPLFPSLRDDGILRLYYTSDYSEQNETLPLYLDYSILAPNDTVNVQRIWINITEIQLLGKRAGNSVFFTNDDVFDVLDGLNETQLLKAGNLTAATYSGIQIYFDTTIIIQTDEGFYELELQSKNFVTLPFNMFGQENGMFDLDIVENTINEVVLDFNLEILWQNSSVMITTKALVM
ncbi:MAG: hypothetical protein HeimAB125_21760 [Candidatus Heimdallarchaeota archaeon AB_125]|nr:MAG: hypothetical protein HeimAB125_21760 [Candidatus Heimdallarchaeota archaeon AB_125]